MPKAPVDEYDLAAPREDEIWAAWQVSAVQAEAIACPVKQRSNEHFRTRISALYRTHDCAALFRRERVRHPAA
jgi:hypothetical protein